MIKADTSSTGGSLRQLLSVRTGALPTTFWLVALASILVSTSAALMTVVSPAVGLGLAFGPFILYFIVTRSWARVTVVVAGGVLVLGSSNDVGAQKVIYAAAFVLCAVISSCRLLVNPPTWFALFRPVITFGLVVLACLTFSAVANPGADVTTTIRQGIFYVMIPFAPIIGLDAGRDSRARSVMRWIALVGCVAAVGFAADWLNRRGVSSLPIGRFIVSSLMLPTLAFALAVVRVVYARGLPRVMWFIPIVAIPAALLVTGTRTNLIVFLALIGVLGTTSKRRVNVFRMLGLATIAAATIAVVFPLLADAVIAQPGFIETRMQALLSVLDGNAVGDQSYAARNEQYYYAAQWIAEAPWLGKGPGFLPPISLDTPLAVVVRVGVVGTIALGVFLGSLVFASRQSARLHGYTFMHTTLTGVAVVCLANLPFGTVVEDKGFAFMLVLLTMGLGAYAQERDDMEDLPIGRPIKERKFNAPTPAYDHMFTRSGQPS